MMTQFSKQELLLRAADRASDRPEFLGYLFGLYSRAHSLDRAALAQELDCSEEKVIHMSLCLRPGRGARSPVEDADRISARFSVESGRLIHIIRSAETLEAFQEVTPQGLLMAAREWEEENEDRHQDEDPSRGEAFEPNPL